MVNVALRHSFLMHSILAISALHLSSENPVNRQMYLSEADTLHREGLQSFNKIAPPQESAFVPAFLFSFITGMHRMCTAMVAAKGDLDIFLNQFIECIEILRGVTTILAGRLNELRESELAPFIPPNNSGSTSPPVSSSAQTQVLKLNKMIESSQESDATATILKTSVQQLSQIFVHDKSDEDESVGNAPVWMMAAPSGFTRLLVERNPAAMVILGYVAVLLHYRRRCWAVGDSGRILIRVLYARVPSQWQEWLEWPRSVVES